MRTRNHHPWLFGLFSRNNGGRRENNACSRCGSPLYLHCEECRWIGRGGRRRGRCWLARVGQIDVFKIVVGVIVASVIIGWLEAKARWPRGGRWTGTVPPPIPSNVFLLLDSLAKRPTSSLQRRISRYICVALEPTTVFHPFFWITKTLVRYNLQLYHVVLLGGKEGMKFVRSIKS